MTVRGGSALAGIVMAVLLLGACVGPGKPKVDKARVAELNTRLGLEYLQQDRPDLARVKLDRALQARPHSAAVNWANALLYEKLGDMQKAESFYHKAVKYGPDSAEAHNHFGTFLCKRGRVEEAIEHFDKAAANTLYLTPEYALTNAGLCLLEAGDEVKAETYFRKALDRNPRHAAALYQMALLTYRQKRYLSSRAYRERLSAVMKGPQPKVLWLCVVTERAMNNYSEADRCEKALKTRFPASEEASSLY